MSFQSLQYGCIVIILANFPASRWTVFLFDALLIAPCADDLEKYLIAGWDQIKKYLMAGEKA